jgi:hypothetical protein
MLVVYLKRFDRCCELFINGDRKGNNSFRTGRSRYERFMRRYAGVTHSEKRCSEILKWSDFKSMASTRVLRALRKCSKHSKLYFLDNKLQTNSSQVLLKVKKMEVDLC